MSRSYRLSLLSGVALLALTVGLRARYPGFVIRGEDILLALLPLLLYALVTGKIKRLEIGGLKLDSRFQRAANSKLTREDIVPISPIVAERASPVDEQTGRVSSSLRSVLRKRPNTLKLVLRAGDVDLPICDYLEVLAEVPTFKYVVFEDFSQEFAGFIPVSDIAAQFTPGGVCTADNLLVWLFDRNFEEISKVHGFVGKGDAADLRWDKRFCLMEMQDRKLDVLPVVEKTNLLGVVEKTHLVTSLIVDVSSKLEG